MIKIFSNFVPFQNLNFKPNLKKFFNIKLSFEFEKKSRKKVSVQNTSAAKLY